MQTAQDLSFHQRVCFYTGRLIAPSTVLHGAVVAGFGQLRNVQHLPNEDLGALGSRFEAFYGRRLGQNASEMLAGYLNHEDPRFRPSQEHGFWNRTRAAFSSVLVATDADGNSRPALAPIAGSLGSGMMSMAFFKRRNTFADGLERSGFTYTTYFATALAHEFKPDLIGLASHFRHKKDQE